MSLLSARAAAEPTPSVAAGSLRGTCALGYALAVAGLEGRRAHALGGVVLREGLESVRALKRALLFAVTDGLGVVRELAFVLCGRFVYLLEMMIMMDQTKRRLSRVVRFFATYEEFQNGVDVD